MELVSKNPSKFGGPNIRRMIDFTKIVIPVLEASIITNSMARSILKISEMDYSFNSLKRIYLSEFITVEEFTE